MNKSGLLVRVALVIGFSAIAIGFLSTQLFYRITYLKEVELANHDIKKLHVTVSATAAIAAYLVDQELAKEVVNGLSTNEIVLNAAMQFDGATISSNQQTMSQPLAFPLFSPFEKNRKVGTLIIQPNFNHIESRAKHIGMNNVKAMMVQSFVVTIVAICIAFYLITRPLINIAKTLHNMSPGSRERLETPEFHKNSELGELVYDVNKLLEETEAQFTKERKLRREIELLEKRFRMLFENSTSPIVLMEPRGNILLFNNSFETLLNKLGINFRKSFGPLLEKLFFEPNKLHKSVQTAFSNDEISTGEYKLVGKDNEHNVWVQVVVNLIISEDLKEYYQITLHDISKRKKELEDLAYQADFDQLTKLYNRHGMERIIKRYIEEETPFIIVLMDLNRFKRVNDIFGHESGDEILVFVSDKIKKSLDPEDHASRWGGDEFVLLLKHNNENDLRRVTTRIIERITKPYFLRKFNENVQIGASMGAAFFPKDESSMQRLLNRADQAMYDVKKMKSEDPQKSLSLCSENTSSPQVASEE